VRAFAAFLGRSPDTATRRTFEAFNCIWRSSRSARGRSTPPSPRCGSSST
jgi:hypothetical protein